MGVRLLGRLCALALVPLAAVVVPPPAHALLSTYYVSSAGSDSAAGTQQAPFRTIAKATATAPAGATIVVGSGQ
jgi:hypothetical protein